MKRRRRNLGAIDVDFDRERLAEMRERPAFFQKTADSLVAAACRLVRTGNAFGGRKVFLADVAKEVGIPMARLAPMVVHANTAGFLQLARADLTAAMDPAKVDASEVRVHRGGRSRYPDASYHFIEIDPAKCRR